MAINQYTCQHPNISFASNAGGQYLCNQVKPYIYVQYFKHNIPALKQGTQVTV